MQINQAALRQPVAVMAPVVLGVEEGRVEPGGTPPESKASIRNAPIELGSDLEPVVLVLLGILEERGDLVPDGAPGGPDEPEPGSEAGGIAEREVETEQNALATRHRRRQPIAEKLLCGVPGRRVLQPFATRCMPADPDAVAPG